MRSKLQCVILAFSLLAFGQEPTLVHRRPKIAVVLEGGGALGFAHIGVLQWMEEHHIPVDYVAGTSMGGLVGGAYATGMHPLEVRELVKSIDWDAVLRGSTEFADLSFRRKQDSREYPNSLEFGLRHGARFPAGFNSGQQVEFILDRIALPYSTDAIKSSARRSALSTSARVIPTIISASRRSLRTLSAWGPDGLNFPLGSTGGHWVVLLRPDGGDLRGPTRRHSQARAGVAAADGA